MTFLDWYGGGCEGQGNPCVLTPSQQDVEITAIFDDLTKQYLTTSKAGDGQGTIDVTPDTANTICEDNWCLSYYPVDTPVTLVASASAESEFTGWSGGVCSGIGDCQITIGTSDQTIFAEFTSPESTLQSLHVKKTGTGSGTVQSVPTGINCGSNCDQVNEEGTSVSLTATATAGFSFGGWMGGGCSGTASCVVTVNDTTVVYAEFIGPLKPTLNVFPWPAFLPSILNSSKNP